MLLLIVRFGLPIIAPGFESFRAAFLGGLISMLAIFVWWGFFSHAPRTERWGAILLTAVALSVTWLLNHESVGLLWCLGHALPILSLALVAWAVASRRLANGSRLATMAATILLASGIWTLVRVEGLTGAHFSEFAWRWTETREQRFLAQAEDEPMALSSASDAERPDPGRTDPDWSGFRGPHRDGKIPDVRVETDWSASPPVELWRRPIGPGWSSFAVHGDRLYTQEQRGDEEAVTCYSLTTGEPIWRHRDTARFWESIAGAGPRATPTLQDDRLYTFGATGILNVLDAVDGTVVWSRNAASDAGAEAPNWGFTSSPLVANDLVVVSAAGRLVAYDLSNGELRWLGPDGGVTYSSPHLVTLDGVEQILLLGGVGATSFAFDGTVLWENAWKGQPLVQPALIASGDVVTSAGEGYGVRRLAVANGAGGWTVEERWTSNRLKPNFNDFVVHKDHAFGFDGNILACIDLEDGERKWKGGRYGQGQLVFLSDQDLLLVISEKGDLALVEASAEKFSELARFPAIEGKTWNHPVVVDDVLLVRNGQEMAAFRLRSPARRASDR